MLYYEIKSREDRLMPLICEKRDNLAILTLSRPEARNAWCSEFFAGFRERLPELE